MLLTQVINSGKTKKLAIILVLAGIFFCILILFPPVQKIIFSFVDANISRKGAGGAFGDRLQSLLSLPFLGLIVLLLGLCCLFSKTIIAFLDNDNNRRLIIALTIVISLLLLGYTSYFSYKHGWQWINYDHSPEMVLGKLLADENTFVSRNWHYSTEIRLIYQTIFTMPLFKLLGRYENWALIRALTILLNNLTLILSYLYLAKQMKIQTKWICITSLFIILPISIVYWNIVLFGGYYTLFIAQLFCCLGLFIRLAGHSDTVKKPLAAFILFTALSFALGLQGIRSLLNVHIPLLIACVYLYSRSARKKIFSLFLGCYGFIVCCIGFAANYLLHFWYSFSSFENKRLTNLWAEFLPKLGKSLVYLAGFFGLSSGSSLLSARGLFSIASIIGTFLLFWAVFRSFRHNRIQNNSIDKPVEFQFITVFFIVSVIFNISVFIIVDEGVFDRYVIPFMVLYIPLAAVLFEYTEKIYGHLKRMALILGIVLFVFGQSYLNFQSLAVENTNSARKGYVKYLLDNQLEYGFSTFWNSNVTTELTNGKIEIAGLDPYGLDPGINNRFRIWSWLGPMKYFNPSYHSGESFLLLTRTEWKLAQETGRSFTQLQPDYEDSDFIVIRYPSAEIIYREVLDN